jgi:hypothetical protein
MVHGLTGMNIKNTENETDDQSSDQPEMFYLFGTLVFL